METQGQIVVGESGANERRSAPGFCLRMHDDRNYNFKRVG